MNELKFRIWDKQKQQYFDVKNGMVLAIGNTDKYLAFSTNQGLYPIPDTGQKDLGQDRWIIEQFIGIKDKFGADIYIGDLVNFSTQGITHGPESEDIKTAPIWWSSQDLCVLFGKWRVESEVYSYDWGYGFSEIQADSLKIVGNMLQKYP